MAYIVTAFIPLLPDDQLEFLDAYIVMAYIVAESSFPPAARDLLQTLPGHFSQAPPCDVSGRVSFFLSSFVFFEQASSSIRVAARVFFSGLAGARPVHSRNDPPARPRRRTVACRRRRPGQRPARGKADARDGLSHNYIILNPRGR